MARTGRTCSCYHDVWPFTVMVAVESATVGLNTLFKAASLQGLSYYVFIVYIYAINTLLLLPAPFFFCSKTKLPSRLSPVFWRIILLGSLGLTAHILGFMGIQYSSPTMASSMSNLSPAFTFILAIIFRMEKLALKSSSFHAKFIGTVVSIAGALVVVLYKGPAILSLQSSTSQSTLSLSLDSSQSNWFIGGLLLIGQSLVFSLWFIILTDTMNIYPAKLVVSFFHCLCVAILSTPICLIAEPNMSAWLPSSRAALMAFIFSGFIGPAFLTIVHSWGLHLKGPVYVAIFKPLSIVIAVIMGVIFLGDALHLGSVIGALILSTGVYAVIWGKAKEESITQACSSIGTSSSGKTPLLQSEEVHQDV